jgi:hypothetical protein
VCVVDHLLNYSDLWLHLEEAIDLIYKLDVMVRSVTAWNMSLINLIVALDSGALGFKSSSSLRFIVFSSYASSYKMCFTNWANQNKWNSNLLEHLFPRVTLLSFLDLTLLPLDSFTFCIYFQH